MASMVQCLALPGRVSTAFSSQGWRLVSSSSSSSDRLSLISSRNATLARSGVSPRMQTTARARKFVAAASFEATPGAKASISVTKVLEQLLENIHLTQEQSEAAKDTFLEENNLEKHFSDSAEISAFLALLRRKGETIEEITGMGKAMLRRCLHVQGVTSGALDIVGTGGDRGNTVNISTGAAILAAASGAKVAKRGARSTSSACRSADVLESLGVAINLGPEGVANCVNELGIGFMLATRYLQANRTVAPVEKAYKMRTAFNFLGPILNPARVPYAIVGVHDKSLMKQMASILQEFGVERALVVHSGGLDELSPIGDNFVLEVTPNKILSLMIEPFDFGIPPCTLNDLKGGKSTLNAKILQNVLAGQEGHIANALILNAGAGLMACGVTKNMHDGVALAREVQRSGKARDLLDSWTALSTKLYQWEMDDVMKQHEWEMETSSLR